MATATIGEYRDAVETAKGLVTTQVVDFTGGAANSAAFSSETRHVRVISDAACRFLIGDAVVADGNDQMMAAESTEYFSVEKERGHRISLIAR